MRNFYFSLIGLTALTLFSGSSFGITPPTIGEIKRVVDFYHKGNKSGPVLVQLVPCLKVDTRKESKTQYDCRRTAGSKVPVGTSIWAWTQWFVPKNGVYNDVMIQFLHNGMVRTTKDISLVGGTRMRAFRSEKLKKKGIWELRVIRGKKLLAATKIKVQ